MAINLNKHNYFWQGRKVLLRPLRHEDWNLLSLEETDSEAKRLFNPGIPLPKSDEMVQHWVENVMKDNQNTMHFAIENLKEEFVGTANLHAIDSKNGSFSYSVYIFKAFRRKGYAMDTIRILMKYGFYELRMQKANSQTIETNTGSIKLHEAMGFTIEGRRRSNVFTNGQHFDEVLFGMTRDEFDRFEKRYASRAPIT